MHPARRAAALGRAVAAALPVLALSGAVAYADSGPAISVLPTPSVTPSATPSASPTPTVTRTVTPSPTSKPSAVPHPTATKTVAPIATASHVRRTSSPRPVATRTQDPTPVSTATATVDQVPIGALDVGSGSPTPSAAPVTKLKAVKAADDTSKLSELSDVVLGGALLLGVGGGVGLYLTRHRHH